MTLEDFFTLTEMKDGLTAQSRVQELVTVMQNDKDSFANNAGDATRQWAAVANTIAATENRDCLDLFIQLDGLWFVDRWLKDAQTLGDETNESFVEESITALLRALEKMHIDNKRSISSGIWSTVKSLLGHKSSKVQERARQLFDSWKQNDDAVHLDVLSAGVVCADESSRIVEEDSKPSALNITSEVGTNRDSHTSGPSRDELFPLRACSALQPESADSVHVRTFSEQSSTQKILDNADINHMSPDHLASTVVLDPIQETPSKDEPSICSVEGTTTRTSSCPVARLSNVEDHPPDSRLNEFSKSEKQDIKGRTSPNKLGVADLCSESALSEPRLVSSGADGGTSQVFATDSALQKNITANPAGSCLKSTALGDEGTASDAKDLMESVRVVDHCNNTVQDGECCSNARQDDSGNGSMSGKLEDLETSYRMADLGAVDEDKEHTSNGDEDVSYGDEEHASVRDEEHTSDEDEDLTIAKYFPKPAIDAKSPKAIDKRMSDIGLEYGMDDALEFARHIAQEVEREVEGEREPFCSSSTEKISEGGIRKADSPDSTYGDQDLPTQVSPKEEATEQSHSSEADPETEDHVVTSENRETIPDQCINDMESSQVAEAAPEPEVSLEKGLCSFDLNQEVCSDEMDRPVNLVATPIAVVSVSRPVASAGLPVAPLQFEGVAIGWKGSTRNSAFRRASPRRFSDGDNNLSAGATSDSSKQRQDYLDFDLNVTEGGGDDLGKPIAVSSGLPSGDSSVEVSQNRLGRPNLDLNRMDDDGDALPPGLRVEAQFLPIRNSHRSPSPASSSSSMQPSMRNFDLNDRPYFHNDYINQGPSNFSQNPNAYGWPKGGAPVISIMGTRVEINRKDAPHQMLSLANGKAIETPTDASMARMGSLLDMGSSVSYTHPPVYAYNGLATGPTMSFSSAMHGPGMVDFRGAPVVPQIMASASAVPAAPYSHSPFIMNMNAAQPGLNVAGPSRPSFDLNSGLMVEGGNWDLGVRQLFIPGQGRSIEDHLRNNSQLPSGSTIVGKRKEPDGGWEPPYPFSYMHQQPPWR